MGIINKYLSASEIADKVTSLGVAISQDYKNMDVLLVCVLKGAVVFFADLLRALSIDPEIDFIQVSSYGMGTESSGILTFQKDLLADVSGRHILLVEDMIDTGFTLYHLKQHLLERGAASCGICTLLDKPSRRKMDIIPDYTGFTVPDKFLVGYGLDFGERYRSLPYLGIVAEASSLEHSDGQ